MITVKDLKETFPVLKILADEAILRQPHYIASEMAGISGNYNYAFDIAEVLISYIQETPYSSLKQTQTAYRATVELFLQLAQPGDKHTASYIRSIARATEFKRTAAAFRIALIGSSRKFKLPIPSALLETKADNLSVCARVRLPAALLAAATAKAEALGMKGKNGKGNLSEYIRHLMCQDLEKEKVENNE